VKETNENRADAYGALVMTIRLLSQLCIYVQHTPVRTTTLSLSVLLGGGWNWFDMAMADVGLGTDW